MVTAEFAAVLPFVALTLAFCLAALMLGVDHVRTTDAARAGARAASAGEATSVVRRIVQDRVVDDSTVTVEGRGDSVRVRVVSPSPFRRIPLLSAIPGADATAEARWEPGARP